MFSVAIVDTSAVTRSALSAFVDRMLSTERSGVEHLPHLSVRPLSLEELHFRAAPEICLIGEGIYRDEPEKIPLIRRTYPTAQLIATGNESSLVIGQIEHLVRLGIDDVISFDISPAEFFKKLVLMIGRQNSTKPCGGLIVLDSGKGGSGVSSVSAALGELAWQSGYTTTLVDTDYETQDLCRFLQVRPFINDALQSLFEKRKPVTVEAVEECCLNIQDNLEDFKICPSASGMREIELHVAARKFFNETIHILRKMNDVVIVDASGAGYELRKFLYQRASQVILLIENDAAAVFAALARIQYCRSLISRSASLKLFQVERNRKGLNPYLIRKELSSAAKISSEQWADSILPYSARSRSWPGSGMTINHFDRSVKKSMFALWSEVKVKLIEDLSITEQEDKKIETEGFLMTRESEVRELPGPGRSLLLPERTVLQTNVN